MRVNMLKNFGGFACPLDYSGFDKSINLDLQWEFIK